MNIISYNLKTPKHSKETRSRHNFTTAIENSTSTPLKSGVNSCKNKSSAVKKTKFSNYFSNNKRENITNPSANATNQTNTPSLNQKASLITKTNIHAISDDFQDYSNTWSMKRNRALTNVITKDIGNNFNQSQNDQPKSAAKAINTNKYAGTFSKAGVVKSIINLDISKEEDPLVTSQKSQSISPMRNMLK